MGQDDYNPVKSSTTHTVFLCVTLKQNYSGPALFHSLNSESIELILLKK